MNSIMFQQTDVFLVSKINTPIPFLWLMISGRRNPSYPGIACQLIIQWNNYCVINESISLLGTKTTKLAECEVIGTGSKNDASIENLV